MQLSTLQPFLIDFGQCWFREDCEDDDDFAYFANPTDSQGAIGVVMAGKVKGLSGVKLDIRYEPMECNYNSDKDG